MRRKIRVGSEGNRYTFEHTEEDGTKIADLYYGELFPLIEEQLAVTREAAHGRDPRLFFDAHETLCNYVSVLRWRYKL